MDWNRIEGNWKQFKGKIKEQWGHLTDDDLDKIAGKREQLEGKIQERAGITKDAARKSVDDWLNKQRSSLDAPEQMYASSAPDEGRLRFSLNAAFDGNFCGVSAPRFQNKRTEIGISWETTFPFSLFKMR